MPAKNVVTFLTGILIAVILTPYIGCSSGKESNPVIPEIQISTDTGDFESNRYLWGLWNIAYNPEENTAEVVPLRYAADHWNVLKFLEQGPCTDCLELLEILPQSDGTINFHMSLTHPFTNPNLTGFDVRGIAMFDGSVNFPEAGVTGQDANLGDGEFISAEGFTALYNSTTIGSGPGGLEGYLPGIMATSTYPDSILNGYVRYWSVGADNTRSAFYAGDTILRDNFIDMPDSTFVFGYAVDACWTNPTVTPVTDPMADFPPEANCPEPNALIGSTNGTGLTDKGGELAYWVRIYDRQGMDSHGEPELECPEIWTGVKILTFHEEFPTYSLWRLDLTNENLAPAGEYKCLVRVEDNENGSAPPHLDLTAYLVDTLEVLPDDGWAMTWGGEYSEVVRDVGVSSTGSVYVTGYFSGDSVDFDPGPGEDLHSSNGETDIYTSRYDQFGEYEWTVTIGGPGYDMGTTIDGYTGGPRIGGTFSDTVDFDPGDGVATRSSNGQADAFVLLLDQNGDFRSVATWGGSGHDAANSIDSVQWGGNYVVVGSFRETVDFDPGPGVLNRTALGGSDCYLSSFELDGDWLYTMVWGGTSTDVANSVAVTPAGQMFVAGYFSGTADFDPGSGTSNRFSQGIYDAFLAGYDEEYNFVYASSWGGSWEDYATGVACDDDGVCYVSGYYNDTVDFDPSVNPDYHTSVGGEDPYLAKYSAVGGYQWVRVWGGEGWDEALAVCVDKADGVYVGGWYEATVDFDPGTPVDEYTSNGASDAFLSKFLTDGSYSWVRVIGGADEDTVFGVSAQEELHVFPGGGFNGTVDFDPGPGTDEHISNGASDAFLTKYFLDGSW